jgi:HupE / UreJ protein
VRHAFLIWLALLFACVAQAHERSESSSHWTLVNGELHGVVTARSREVTRLTIPGDSYASLAQIFSAHVERSVAASVDGSACSLRQAPAILESEPGYLRVDLRMRCGAGDLLTLKLGLFFTVAPSHHHFLYVESGPARREAILTASAPTAELELRSTSGNKTHFLQFIGMGIEHIATGIDHLAFLLALLISARTARQVLSIVTGFTLGHSLTLSLAVLGVVQANRGAVECLIGLTIALAAAQNLIRGEREGRLAGLAAMAITASLLLIPSGLRPDMPTALIMAIAVATGSAVWLASMSPTREPTFSIPARFTMAAGFGLIHGLGFASALQDLHLPRPLLLESLFGFNVGVEIGQLAVVIAAVLLIKIAGTMMPAAQRRSEISATLASAALLTAGLAWFLMRATS